MRPVNTGWPWRFSVTALGLETGSVALLGMAGPDTADPYPFSIQDSRSDGGTGGYGYSAIEMAWRDVPEEPAAKLVRLIVEARETYGGVLYVTFWTGAIYDGVPRWIDARGYVRHPERTSPSKIGGTYRGALKYDLVSVVINNLRVINDPSAYSGV